MPCYPRNSTTGIPYSIIGCDKFIVRPMGCPVTFQVQRGLQTAGQLPYFVNFNHLSDASFAKKTNSH